VRLLVRREPQEFALFHGILSRAHVSSPRTLGSILKASYGRLECGVGLW
jgi:hypothetical protein